MSVPATNRPEQTWNGIYTDDKGRESIVIVTDGAWIRTEIRGVRLEGRSPDNLWPVADQPASELERIALREGRLSGSELVVDIPVLVVMSGTKIRGCLRASCEPNSHYPSQIGPPVLELAHGEQVLRLSARSSDFEAALPQLEEQLPEPGFLKTCLRCQWSDYSPSGTMEFGSMSCFRHLRAEYMALSQRFDKMTFFELEYRSEDTQETYLCPDFTLRTPGTGYRG